ncbi:cytosolic sulfotransferase 5-like [Typha angustifolia]|uniref:cytosolic sulfotransferase 5-like n=1 Tax=Typha angustifolia TaxID=59011 RepID=UPI003C2BF7EB
MAPIPPHAREIEETNGFLSSLPLTEDWILPLRLYQSFWLYEPHIPHVIAAQHQVSFTPRPSDVILSTFPKCGTTWLKALAFAVMNRSVYAFSDHPLLSKNPHECVPYLEIPLKRDAAVFDFEKLPSPRLLATHMPYSMLPASVAGSDCKVIYLCREPKDTFVSLWHFHKMLDVEIELGPAFDLFCDGVSLNGPFWDHVLDYWKESLKRPDKVLFLKYEEMLTDTTYAVRKLAKYMGCPFSSEEEKDGVVEEVAKLCSFKKLTGLEVNKDKDERTGKVVLTNASFFRKGEVGDWSNHLSPQMGKKLDSIVKHKCGDSGLTF